MGGIGVSFGMFGGFMNDNDALEVELGEVRKAEPDKNVPIGGPRIPESPTAERPAIKEAVAKEAVPKGARNRPSPIAALFSHRERLP